MDAERQPKLRTVSESETGAENDAAPLQPAFGVNPLAEVVAIPYALEGDTLRIGVADPGNVHAIDELRLATRYQLEISVAAREDIENEIRRLARAAEAFGARAVLEDEAEQFEEVDEDEEA